MHIVSLQQDCQEFLALLLGSLQDNHAPSKKASPEQSLPRQQAANISKLDDDASSQQQEDDMLPQQQSDVMTSVHGDDTTETTATQNVSSDVSLSPHHGDVSLSPHHGDVSLSPHHGDDDTAMELSSSPEESKATSLDIVKEFEGVLHNKVCIMHQNSLMYVVMVTGVV